MTCMMLTVHSGPAASNCMLVCVYVAAAIVENNVGHTVTVGIERSNPRRLQTVPLIKSQDAGLGKRYINQYLHS